MGNAPSAEVNRKSLPPRPPSPSLRPLPPLPPLPQAVSAPAPTPAPNKLSKPRTRTRSTSSLIKSPDSLARSSTSARFSTLGLAHFITSSSSPNSPSASSFAAAATSRPLPPLPSPISSAVSPVSPALSTIVFTFEEAVAAVTGQKEPNCWQPMPSVYPSPDLDLELLQEQQSRQIAFQERQRQNHLHFQQQQHDPHTEERPSQRTKKLKQRLRNRGSMLRSKSLHRCVEPPVDYSSRRRNSIGQENPYTGDWNSQDPDPVTYDQVLNQYYGGSAYESRPQQVGPRASWNYDLSSYEAKRLLHIVDDDMVLDHSLERSSAASESRYSLLSEATWKSSHPVQPQDETLRRANSDLSLYAPVRRRSMMQIPGVATRRNSSSSLAAGGNARSRPNFRHSQPVQPSFSRCSSFESSDSRVLSMPPLPRARQPVKIDNESVPRASTPVEDDYQVTGAFKLGSLRITNGVASPMSSPEAAKPRKTNKDMDKIHSSPFNFAARTQALAALSGQDITDKEKCGGKEDEHASCTPVSPIFSEPRSSPVDVVFAPAKSVIAPLIVKNEPELPQIEPFQDLFADFDFGPFSLIETAAEAPNPPPARPVLEIPMLQTTSKTAAVEDHLFEEDGGTPEYEAVEVLDVRLDPNAKSKSATSRPAASALDNKKSARSIQGVTRSDSGFVSSPTSESSHKPLSKADSGYSSNVSLRSLKLAASKLMAPVAAVRAAALLSGDKGLASRGPHRESFYIDELKLPSPTFDESDLAFFTRSEVVLPITKDPLSTETPPPPPIRVVPPPRHKLSLLPPVRHPTAISIRDVMPRSHASAVDLYSSSTVPSAAPATDAAALSPKPRVLQKRHTQSNALEIIDPRLRVDDFSSPVTSPVSVAHESVRSDESNSALSIGTGVQQPRKLRHLFGFGGSARSRGPPTVYLTHVDDQADIPTVPQEVQEKLHEHAGLFPMTTKRLALKSQISSNTLKTIFSVGSLENRSNVDTYPAGGAENAASSSAIFPAVAEEEDEPRAEPRASNRRHTFQAVPSSLKRITNRASLLGLPSMEMEGSRDAYEEQDGRDADGDELCRRKPATKVPLAARGKPTTKKGKQALGLKKEESVPPSPGSILDIETEPAMHSSTNNNLGNNPYDAAAITTGDDRDCVVSSTSRDASLTESFATQLERSLNVKLPFPRLIRPTARTEGTYSPPAAETASPANDMPLSLGLPSPIFAEMMEQQRLASLKVGASSSLALPMSARTQQRQPSLLPIPPPPRSRSTPPEGIDSGHVPRERVYESLPHCLSTAHTFTSGDGVATIGTAMTSPVARTLSLQHANNGTAAEYESARPPSRRGSVDQHSWRNSMEHSKHSKHSRQGSGEHRRSNSMVSCKSYTSVGYRGTSGPQSSTPSLTSTTVASGTGPSSMLRHRASYDGHNSGRPQGWSSHSGSHGASSQYDLPAMSSGYTQGTYENYRKRSGSSSSGGSFGTRFQYQQQQAWDIYYHQYAGPPPYASRAYHQRSRSSGSQNGPPAPYRILHSYDSPAYRGVPIWG